MLQALTTLLTAPRCYNSDEKLARMRNLDNFRCKYVSDIVFTYVKATQNKRRKNIDVFHVADKQQSQTTFNVKVRRVNAKTIAFLQF